MTLDWVPQKLKQSLNQPFVVLPFFALILFLLSFFKIVNFHELDAVDLRFHVRGVQKAHPDIVLVTIDDASLRDLGEWPWPRGHHGVLLDVLNSFRPQLIFFDILFTEKSLSAEEDSKFEYAIQKAGNVILPFFYNSPSPFQATFPIEQFRKAALDTAYVNVNPDEDGIVRSVQTELDSPDGRYFQPAVLIYNLLAESNPSLYKPGAAPRPKMWINYPGAEPSFQAVSFRDVIQSVGTDGQSRLQTLLENKIVLVGQTATGTTDIRATPFSTQSPGLYIHASALHTLLTGKPLRLLPEWAHIVFLAGLSLIMAFNLGKVPPVRGFVLTLGMITVYAALNFGFFAAFQWILPVVLPAAVMILNYVILLFMKYTEIRFEREMISRELAMAAQIQENFLPQEQPKSDALDAAFECRFIKQVGGDLYDWTAFENHRFGFCVGDVSGKGMPAAIYMAKAMSDLRSLSRSLLAPHEVCSQLNHVLCLGNLKGMFLTLIYSVLDMDKKILRYASAAHEFLILFRVASGTAEIVKGPQGVPLGMFEGMPYETAEIALNAGDAFLFYSDGVKELRNEKKQEFGTERLRLAVEEESRNAPDAKQFIHNLFVRMDQYRGTTQPHDDRTLVYVRLRTPGNPA